MVKRSLLRILQETKKSILLLGPRQVGKSTLLAQLNPDLVINLASETEYFRHSSDPTLLESIIEEQKPKIVFIDEVQRIPSLLNSVQFFIDRSKKENKSIRFLLSGSSARKLRRGHANLLPGRIRTYTMAGLANHELGNETQFRLALETGFLPEPYFEKNKSDARRLLSDYAATYLTEEIQAEALTRNIQGFSRFLKATASVAGQIFDVSKLASRSKLGRTTSVRFFEILEDTLIAQRIYCYDQAQNADIIKHPKLYFFDVGVLNGLLENFKASEDRIGYLFEHLVYNQIRNSALARDQKIDFYFFRTRGGVEVDFILKYQDEIWAVEVKSGQIQSQDLENLKAFKKYYPKVKKLIAVSLQENQRRTRDGVLVCNLKSLLEELGF